MKKLKNIGILITVYTALYALAYAVSYLVVFVAVKGMNYLAEKR